jgi:hypothetical protein
MVENGSSIDMAKDVVLESPISEGEICIPRQARKAHFRCTPLSSESECILPITIMEGLSEGRGERR